MMLWIAVHLAALAFGAWVVLSNEAALLLAWLALMLAVLALPLARWMFAAAYGRWLQGDHVIRVTGWRSALVETPHGQRRHMTACFWGLE